MKRIGKKWLSILLRTAVLVILLAVTSPQLSANVYASGYTSWIQDTEAYEEFYENAISAQEQTPAETEDENFLIKALGTLIHFIGADTANDLSGDSINLTIDGVIMGRLAQPTGVSYTSFDLSPGNVYGIAGATIYTVFRGIAYSAMLLIFLFLLAKTVIKNDAKSREDLKQGIYTIFINFVLIYLMPQIVDITIFLRDQLMYTIMQHMSNDTSIINAMNTLYMEDKSLIKGIVYTATVFASLFYIKDYVTIAIQQTVLFGFFCIFTVLGVTKKKFLSDWCSMFFSNLLVPLIDIIGLMLPYAALNAFSSGGARISFGGACVVVMMVWSARACRREILKLFGNMTGSPAGRGLAGLATMAQMARMAHMASRGRFGGGEPYERRNSENFASWNEEAEQQRNTATNMDHQAGEIGKGLPDVESYESATDSDDVMDNTQRLDMGDDFVNDQENDYELPADENVDTPAYAEGEPVNAMDSLDALPEEGGYQDPSPADFDREMEYTDPASTDLPENMTEKIHEGIDTPEENVVESPADYPVGDGQAEIDEQDKNEESIPAQEPEADVLQRPDDDTVSPVTGAVAAAAMAESEDYTTPQAEEEKIPNMSEFEKERYKNLEQMDAANASINAAKEDIDNWNNENAMLDNRIQNIRDRAYADTASDRQDIADLNRDNSDLDMRIQQNDADGRKISTLQEQNKAIDREIEQERRSISGSGEQTNDRINSLTSQRDENARKIADLQEGISARNSDWATKANETEQMRINALQQKNAEIDRNIAAEKQSGNSSVSSKSRIEALTRERESNTERIAYSQSRIQDRADDLRLERARNTKAIEDRQSRLDTSNESTSRQIEDINARKTQNRQNITNAQSQIGTLTAQLESRKNAEEQFATISRANGKDASRYASAKEMRLHVEQRNNRLDELLLAAEKRGGVSKEMLRDLSPEGAARVAEVQREAIRKANLRHAMATASAGTAKAAALTTGAALGAVITMYGGEEASLTGAMLGGMAGSGIANAGAKAGRTLVRNREEILADIKAGANAVSDAASSSYRQTKEVFSGQDTVSSQSSKPVRKKTMPEKEPSSHERMYQETMDAMQRNGRETSQNQNTAEDTRSSHEKMRDETLEAIGRRERK